MPVKTVYKLMTAAGWEAARAEGVYRGSEADLRDGFIHFSTAAQAGETARKHFAGVPDLVLLAVGIEMLEKLHVPAEDPTPASGGSALRWEPSRGGELFPHLYAHLPAAAVQSASPVPLADDGTPIIPADLAS